MKVTHDAIESVLNSLLERSEAELQQIPRTELDRYWHFKWDDMVSLETNLYLFHDRLKLYSSFCRRWEETHNGHCCVVERVRDTYLMPRIREFSDKVRASQLLHEKNVQ